MKDDSKMKLVHIDKDEGEECTECKHSDAWMITLFYYAGSVNARRAKIQRTYCVGCFIKNAGLLRKASK